MNDTNELLPVQQLRATQIIAVALLLGLGSFAGIAVWLVQNQGGGLAAGMSVVTWVAMGAFVIEVPLSFIVPRLVIRRQVKGIVEGKPPPGSPPIADGITGQLAAVYQTSTILGLALLEGVGFLASTAYLLEGRIENLGIVGVVSIVMIMRFPTANRLLDWIEQQAEAIEQLRQERALGPGG